MSSRLLTLTGLASVAAIALAWSAFAADDGGNQGDRNGNADSQRGSCRRRPPAPPARTATRCSTPRPRFRAPRARTARSCRCPRRPTADPAGRSGTTAAS